MSAKQALRQQPLFSAKKDETGKTSLLSRSQLLIPAAHGVSGFDDELRLKGPLPYHAASLPKGYVAQDDGIYYLREDKKGDLQPEFLCSPLALAGACRRADGKGWGRVVDVCDE